MSDKKERYGTQIPSLQGTISTSSQGVPSQSQPASTTSRASSATDTSTSSPYQSSLTPGAVAVRGYDYYDDDGMSRNDDSTIVIGDSLHRPQGFTSSTGRTVAAVEDAFVVHSSTPEIQHQQTLPPLVDAQVDTTSLMFSSNKQTLILLALLLSLVVIGVAVGVLYGVVWKDDDDETSAPIVSPPTTLAPTMSMSPTASPTALAWEDAGGLDIVVGEMLALSAEGKRIAVVDSNSNTTIRVHQQEEIDGTWVQLGATIDVSSPVNSLSLAGTRLAVGSIVGNEMSVREFLLDNWTLVASPIALEGWTVALSQDGAVLAVETSDSVQVYTWNAANDGWIEKGGAIATRTTRVNPAGAYSRLAMNADGNTLIVELFVYTYNSSSNEWSASLIPISSSPPNTPVSMSTDGLVVAIAQPQSNINGLNSGKLSVFRNDADLWRQEGDDIIGDEIQGFWGWSHSLSGDASRIAIMNNPDGGGTNQASVFHLQGSQWIHLLDQMPSAVSNGTIVMSKDGTRVVMGGAESTVRVYDIVGM